MRILSTHLYTPDFNSKCPFVTEIMTGNWKLMNFFKSTGNNSAENSTDPNSNLTCVFSWQIVRVLVLKKEEEEEVSLRIRNLKKKSVSIVNLPALFTPNIMSKERGQNWSGIYDWYGLLKNRFGGKPLLLLLPSSVPKPCGQIYVPDFIWKCPCVTGIMSGN